MLANVYEKIWESQLDDDEDYSYRIRDEFNQSQDPAKLLYLLARCVKNAPRFNQLGQFNQSVDKRRLGMRPTKMRHEILAASTLLAKHTTAVWADFETTLKDATSADLVYLDPPYEGTTTGDNMKVSLVRLAHSQSVHAHLHPALLPVCQAFLYSRCS